MQYKITIDIESSVSFRAFQLQKIKSLVEETVTTNLTVPDGEVMFVDTKLTNESKE